MHAFVPPHPGPVAAAELVGADIGLVLVFGLLIGLPTWFLGGYMFGTWAGKRYHVAVPDILSAGGGSGGGIAAAGAGDADGPVDGGGTGPAATGATSRRTGGGTGTRAVGAPQPPEPELAVSGTAPAVAAPVRRGEGPPRPADAPSFATVLSLLLLPLFLIFLNTGMNTLATNGTVDEDSTLVDAASLIGATPVALLITVLVASYVLGTRRGAKNSEVESIVNSALGPVCAIILITGAGGMFGGVLRASGIGEALADVLADIGLPVIVAAFIIAVLLRVAQGSATVALTTAAGLIAPVVEATDGLSEPDLALIVIAIAGGATVLSHVNDSGFWLVSRFFQMDEATTLKTWTVMETLLGTLGFVFALLLSLLL